jgi:superfamily II DNA or RNA helicase
VTDLLALRPYQEDRLLAASAEWSSGRKRVAIVLMTGLGKTVIFVHAALAHITSEPTAVLILVHRDELVDQTVEKLRDVAAGFKIGVVKADRNDVNADVIVGSVQTLRNPTRLAQLRPVGLVVVDECHHAAAKSYRDIMTALGCFDYDRPTLALGVTATLTRADRKSLGDIWETVAGEPYDVLDAINDGWLSDVAGKRVEVEGLTLPELRARGDFGDASLTEIMSSPNVRWNVVESYTEHAPTMPGVVFVPSVQTAFDFTEAFAEAGYDVAAVWGAMDGDDRKRVLADFRDGRLQILVNCQVLTEGFDAPRAQCAVIARPTTSAGLYIQMVGRVLRPFPGKDRALVLDVVGASDDHRLATIADLTSRRIEAIGDGESLREAVAREKKERNPRFVDYVIDVEEVDLFGRSRAAWLQTYGGAYFLPVMNAAVFIWPGQGDRYRVGIRPTGRPGGRFIREDVSLDAALSWGEETADRYAANFVESFPGEVKAFNRDRRASWRRQPATGAQLREALRVGLRLDPNTAYSRGEMSDRINVHKISPLLDRKARS